MGILVNDIFHVGLTIRHVDWHKDFLAHCLGMQVLSDSSREGDWISKVTGLPGFKARNVYVTPDGTNRLEMFEIFSPPLVDVPMSLGTYLGVSHVRIGHKDVARIRDQVKKQGLSVIETPDVMQRNVLIFQDASGLFWEIVSHDPGGYGIQIVVSDLDKAMELYSRLLGLEPLARFGDNLPIQDSSGQWMSVNAEVQRIGSSHNQVIDLYQYNNFTPLKNPRDTINYVGFHHIAFRVPDAVGAFEMIRSKGYRYISEPLHIPEGPNRGGILFYFYDGDGTVLEMLQPPSTSNLT
jgi:catechol 2,3-dioxygenase-like lactoylglutathione lyase family enzyme